MTELAAERRGAIVTLLVMTGIIALSSVDRNMLALVLPRLKAELGLSDAMLGVLAGPAELLFLFANGMHGWQSGLAADTLLVSAATPCTFALLLTVVDARMRALGAALYLSIFHLLGQSRGPPLVGLLNGRLGSKFGAEAIRYSMLSAPLSMMLAGLAFLGLSRYLRR